MNKRLFSLFTSLVMVISLVGVMPTMSVGALTSGDYQYSILSDGTVEITKYNGSATNVTIPSTIGGKTVTSIGEEAFSFCESLTSITIPNSVTSFGDWAFYDCDRLENMYFNGTADDWAKITFGDYDSNPMRYAENEYFNNELITEVVLSDDITTINAYAFDHCNSLTSITIPDSVTSIGYRAFLYCDSLTSVTIPDSVTSIRGYAFAYCESLTSITIPDSVTSIGLCAFAWCESLTSITIPDSVTSIGDSAFWYCDSLTSITIPDSVTSIGYGAFYGCDSLTSVTIPDSVTSIGNSAFYSCDSLTSITIPDSVTYIGWEAFRGCESLTSITIPDSVTSIGYKAFYYCNNLTIKCYENSTAHQYAIENDIPYELLPDKTQLEGKVYCQFKDNNTMMRFIAEVDIEDVLNADSGEITVSYNEEVLEVKSITGAYKSLYAGGQVITAPEGKCFIITNQYTGFMYDDMMSVEFALDNYDLGLSRDVIIE